MIEVGGGRLGVFVVGVAKWLRRQFVALEIEGSTPFAHPNQPSSRTQCARSSAD